MGINHSSPIREIEPEFEAAKARDFLEISSNTEEIVNVHVRIAEAHQRALQLFNYFKTPRNLSIKTFWLVNSYPESEYYDSWMNLHQLSTFSREADLQVFKAISRLQGLAKTVFEISDKAEALHDTAEIKQCRALIRFISRELRYAEAEFYMLYYLQAVLLFIVEKSDSARSLPIRVLSVSQALEVILIASGDVEENPGPTFLDGNLIV